ncbi:MAG: calcium-binding protein [Lyngbya sp.]|nr:calcium-binding protein [Lyngbya sp.]
MALFNGTNANDVIAPDQITTGIVSGDNIFPAGVPIPSNVFIGNDQIFGQLGNDLLGGGEGDDLINAGDGDDNLSGGNGSDTLDGGLGNNIIDGQDDFDYVSYENEANVFVDIATNSGFATGRFDILQNIEAVIGSTTSTNSLFGDNEDNVLIGGDLDDNLNGGEGADTLEGGGGSDQLIGGGGKDFLQAGEGSDTYTINNVAFSGGSQIEDTGGNADSLNIDLPLSPVAAPPSPTQIGLARNGKNLIVDISRDGLADPASDLTINNFFADETSNTAGTGFIENLSGLPGNTVLSSGIGEVVTVSINTPVANNTVPGNPVPVDEFSQIDISDDIKLYTLSNEPDTTTVPVDQIDRQIVALSGNDNISGTTNPEDVVGNRGADTLNGGGGDDTLRGGQGSDLVNGEGDDDLLNGNQDNDTINGGLGDDIVRGGRGNDVLLGGDGDDFLIGDREQDILTGGNGEDTFVLTGGNAAANNLDEADLVTDFVTGVDQIMLTGGTTFAQLTLTQVELQIDGGASVMATAIQAPDNAYLGIIQGVTNLTATDFVPEDTTITILG